MLVKALKTKGFDDVASDLLKLMKHKSCWRPLTYIAQY